MNEKEAYGNRDYSERVWTSYNVGDKVTVGPAYRGNGNYQSDGFSGPFTVVKVLDTQDYKVCRGDAVAPYDLIINASRLTPR